MPNEKTQLDRFSDLTWDDIGVWAGGKIVSRGKNYQTRSPGRMFRIGVPKGIGK